MKTVRNENNQETQKSWIIFLTKKMLHVPILIVLSVTVYVLPQNCRAAGWWRVKSVIVYVLRQNCRAAEWWRVKNKQFTPKKAHKNALRTTRRRNRIECLKIDHRKNS
jgi:predicted signal transduction protein with EAL and GGDEF domain